MNKDTILHTVPAAAELHKVPGFDPLKHLCKSVNAQGEPVMRLEPRYQRLWFRLACPKGRMLLNPLRLTDQLAIIEAKVFFHRDDPTPASSFTASKAARETADYIHAAQDEALSTALDNAGFGIQLCDVTQTPNAGGQATPKLPVQTERMEPAPVNPPPASTPVEAVPANAAPSAVSVTDHVQTAKLAVTVEPPLGETTPAAEAPAVEEPSAAAKASVAEEPAPEPVTAVQPVTEETSPVLAKKTAPVPVEQQNTVPHDAAASVDHLAAVLNFSGQMMENAPTQEEPTAEPEESAAPAYTEDMTVEEICKIMSLEQARSVIVTKGTCNGWTMGQVLEKRPSSLRFYLSGFGRCSNVQMAAATLLAQGLDQQKAS